MTDSETRFTVEPQPGRWDTKLGRIVTAIEDAYERGQAEARRDLEQRLRTDIEALIEARGGRCVQPDDFDAKELNICETHSELMFDGSCEDDPRDLRAVLALLAPATATPGEET